MGTRAVAAHGIEQSRADVQIQRVAEFVGARSSAGFDASGKVAGVVAAKAAFPSDAIRSLSVLKPRKSMVLSVISNRASASRFAPWPTCPRGVFSGGAVTCGWPVT